MNTDTPATPEGARPHLGSGGNTINSDTLVSPMAQDPTWVEGDQYNSSTLVIPRAKVPTWAELGNAIHSDTLVTPRARP